MLALLLHTILGFGPVLDPIDGETLTAADAARGPSGRHVSWRADHDFLSFVNLQPGDGGLSRFDRVWLSAHGRAVTQLHFLLNGLEITDPARPGEPLVELPDGAWDSLTHRSLWTDRPGLEWSLGAAPETPLAYAASVGGGRPLGGGTWIPRDFMDREPATDSGAPVARRALDDARELRLSAVGPRMRLAVEYVRDERRFPLTLVGPGGAPLTDVGDRSTVLGAYRLDVGDVPVDLVVAWQQVEESHAGAAYRWPAPLTGVAAEQALVTQLRARLSAGAWRLDGGYGFGWRRGDFAARADGPRVTDLEGEWLWIARPRQDERLSRSRHETRLVAERRRGGEVWLLEGRAAYAALCSRAATPGGLAGVTYERAASGPTAVAMDVYDPPRRAREWLAAARANATLRHAGARYHLEGYVGLDWGAVGTPRSTRLGSLAPAAGAAVRARAGRGEVFALVRREPDAVTAEASSFLDPARPSGTRYRWLDDGDGVPTTAERGEVLGRFGGPFHRAAPELRRPTSNQLALGYATPTFGRLRAVLTAAARLHLDRYTVRYDAATRAGFTEVALAADGAAGASAPHARGALTAAYARTGAAGEELYVLDNDERADFWLGTELQLVTVDERRWFLSLAAAGYWNTGAAPFGVFPERNDPGVVSEASADPNARLNDEGRYDQDRSFSVKLRGGWRPLEPLLVATAVRYRDGEPFVDFGVVEGLPQGPTPVMLRPRGRVRHTFHLSVDVRAAYSLETELGGGLRATAAIDVFNLLGSGTELLEDSRAGSGFRDPLEMMPGRSGFVTVTLSTR